MANKPALKKPRKAVLIEYIENNIEKFSDKDFKPDGTPKAKAIAKAKELYLAQSIGIGNTTKAPTSKRMTDAQRAIYNKYSKNKWPSSYVFSSPVSFFGIKIPAGEYIAAFDSVNIILIGEDGKEYRMNYPDFKEWHRNLPNTGIKTGKVKPQKTKNSKPSSSQADATVTLFFEFDPQDKDWAIKKISALLGVDINNSMLDVENDRITIYNLTKKEEASIWAELDGDKRIRDMQSQEVYQDGGSTELTTNTCRIRKDLLDGDMGVPVGNDYIREDIEYEYQWIGKDEEEFQIKLNGKWQDAQSIDFDFDNKKSNGGTAGKVSVRVNLKGKDETLKFEDYESAKKAYDDLVTEHDLVDEGEFAHPSDDDDSWIEMSTSDSYQDGGTFDREEYNRLDQHLNMLQGQYMDYENVAIEDSPEKQRLQKEIQETEAKIHKMERPVLAKGGIIKYSDGFKWRRVSKEEAEKLFDKGEEVYGLRIDEESEALIEDKSDIDAFSDFGTELGFKSKGGSLDIPFESSNLYLVGSGVDTNGNHIVKVTFPNQRAFSIQTNGTLPHTNRALKSVDKISQLSAADLSNIEKEVNDYVKNYGSDKQKKSLHLYEKNKNFETVGATSEEVDELVLFSDNTESIYSMIQAAYKKAATDPHFDLFKAIRNNIVLIAITKYRKETGNVAFGLSNDQKNEFAKIYVDEFPTWKKENSFEKGGVASSREEIRSYVRGSESEAFPVNVKYSISFHTITPESAAKGEYASHGFEVQDKSLPLSEVLRKAVHEYGISKYNPDDLSWESPLPKHDRDYFDNGTEKYFTLTLKRTDGSPVSAHHCAIIDAMVTEGSYANGGLLDTDSDEFKYGKALTKEAIAMLRNCNAYIFDYFSDRKNKYGVVGSLIIGMQKKHMKDNKDLTGPIVVGTHIENAHTSQVKNAQTSKASSSYNAIFNSMETIFGLVRTGDHIQLTWVLSNNNTNVSDAGLHFDEIYLSIFRQGERKYSFLVDARASKGKGRIINGDINEYKKGGPISKRRSIKDADLTVGEKFKFPNEEIIEIKRLFKENIDEDWVEYSRDGKTQENSVKQLRIFLNNWKAEPIKSIGFGDGGAVGTKVILDSPAIAAEGDNNEYRFVLKIAEPKTNSTLHIERNFRKQGEWDGVPSGWHIGTLLNEEGYYGTGEHSDQIMIDGGQKWGVSGLSNALEEVKGILHISDNNGSQMASGGPLKRSYDEKHNAEKRMEAIGKELGSDESPFLNKDHVWKYKKGHETYMDVPKEYISELNSLEKTIDEFAESLNEELVDEDWDDYKDGGPVGIAEIQNIHGNSMGTTSFEMKMKGMRKFQDFIIYPITGGQENNKKIMIQSDTRIGEIDLSTGKGEMSQSHSGGAYFMHLSMDKKTPFEIKPIDLQELKMKIFTSAGSKVGDLGLVSDNSGANDVLEKGGPVKSSDVKFVSSDNLPKELKGYVFPEADTNMVKMNGETYLFDIHKGYVISPESLDLTAQEIITDFLNDESPNITSLDNWEDFHILENGIAYRGGSGYVYNLYEWKKDVHANGGTIGKDNIVMLEIHIPAGKENVLIDSDGKADGFDFTESISKALTKKYFGHGIFSVELLTKSPKNNKVIVAVKIPNGRESVLIDPQDGKQEGFEFSQFISNMLTKKSFGNGPFSVTVLKASKIDKKNAGGHIGFHKLAHKVAAEYEGKKVDPKYQNEYGKRYSRKEALEVGNKTAARVRQSIFKKK
jgi:hypothetical protein